MATQTDHRKTERKAPDFAGAKLKARALLARKKDDDAKGEEQPKGQGRATAREVKA